jgi:hypothetical protein
MPKHPDDYALVIGINHYPDYRPLAGAIQDAEDFSQWLTQDADGGGLELAHCKTILSSNPPLKPVWDDIDLALSEIRDAARATGARRFYLYFSGHGHASGIEENNLCLGRWSPAGASRLALDTQAYYQFFAECIGFQEIVVLLDCCRVRVAGASSLPPGVNCPKPVAGAGKTQFFKAFATEFQSASFEAAITQNNAPIIRGHFTRALLAALRGGAASPGGGVKPSALKDYLEREVPRIAAEAKHNQTATVPQNNLPDEPASYFGSASPIARANIKIQFSDQRAGEVVLIGPDNVELKRARADAGDWSLTLDPGLYLLVDQVSQEEKPIRFKPEEKVRDVTF